MSCYCETTDDKNGLSSSSWAFATHDGEKKSTPGLYPPFEDRTSGMLVSQMQLCWPILFISK